MRILYVVPWLFYPPVNTASEYHADLISTLAHRGHRVEVVCFTSNQETLSELQSERIVIHALPAALVRLVSASSILRSMQPGIPLNIAKYHVPQFRDEIVKILQSSERPDVALLEHVEVAQYARMIQQADVPVLLHLIDIEAQKLDLLARISRSWPIKLGAWIESKRMLSYELRSVRSISSACISEFDQSVIRKSQPDSKVGVVPLGINLERYPFHMPFDNDGNTIVFIGPADYYKNAAGVKWFVDAVYPHVLELWPQARFRVVNVTLGSPLDRYIKESPRTETVGFVQDVQEEMRKASVLVAPMVVGSGASGRVLTSLALGVPIVATSLACQGLKVRHGEHLWIADTPIEFARGVVAMGNRNSERKAVMILNGRRYVEQNHDINQIATMLEHSLLQLTCTDIHYD